MYIRANGHIFEQKPWQIPNATCMGSNTTGQSRTQAQVITYVHTFYPPSPCWHIPLTTYYSGGHNHIPGKYSMWGAIKHSLLIPLHPSHHLHPFPLVLVLPSLVST